MINVMKCKNLFIRRMLSVTIIIATVGMIAVSAQTPVELHGALRVEGNKIVDKDGNPTQLCGMSFFWSQWMGQFYNKRVVGWLVDDWKVSVVRAAMGVKHVESQSGYLYDGTEKVKLTKVVDAAIKKGIYVIIDWHDHFAFENVKESQKFFKEMARRYGKYPNVIYEIYNEPKQISWPEIVKPYSRTIVDAIRAIDPDNLILIGTPSWCQNVNEAADDPLEGKNLAYSLHFYAATHKGELRDKAQYALDKGIPLFVSEFGTCLASGDGYLDSTESDLWFSFMDEHKLSWCNWSIADKKETASALIPGARYYGQWPQNELTPSGKIIRHQLRLHAGIKDVEVAPKEKRVHWLRIRPL
jgi:endoglucanase